MENIDEQLKINICSILPSISEETVNGIIHAVKYVGVETMSDLPFVHEEDLILVLKPIQRRKLVKAWQEQSCPPVNSSNLSSALPLAECFLPVNSSNLTSALPSAECCPPVNSSNLPSALPSAECFSPVYSSNLPSALPLAESIPSVDSSTLPLQECKWNRNNGLLLLQVYAKYKTELSCSSVEEKQEVWRKIAEEVHERCSLKCNDLQCMDKIKKLKRDYYILKNHENELNEKNTVFFNEAKKVFQPSKNSVSLSAEQSSDVPLLNCLKGKNISEFHCKLLQVYAKYKTEFASPDTEEQKVWEKISREMREMYSYYCSESVCRFELSQLKCQNENLSKDDVKNENESYVSDEAGEAFDISGNLVISPDTASSSSSINYEWKMRRIINLLILYTAYKPELSQPGLDKQIVWKKIAHELQNCDESQCFNKIDELRYEYERIKNKNVTNRETAIFLDEAKKAFESTETTVQSRNKSSLSLKRSSKDFVCKLLQVYGKYKTELLSPDTEERNVWEKIAKEMRERFSYNCGERLCCFELRALKYQYENFKRLGVKNGHMPHLFDDAREVFESSENLDNSNCQVDEIKEKVDVKYVPPHLRNGENRQSASVISSKTENRTFTIKVSNMSENVTETNLEQLFRPFGTIKDSSGQCTCAFISYAKQKDASRAILAMDGIECNMKESALKVEWAKPSELI